MLDFYIPFILATLIGISPAPQDTDVAALPSSTDEMSAVLEPLDPGSGDDLGADREPEPQIPTGKYTTALEVRPILGMTKTNWVGVREFNDQDYVYFTHLMAWRCGLWDIRYGINGAPADIVVPMEPCNEEFAQPNVMVDIENYLPYKIYPLGSVESIYIEIVFDDGTTDFARFNRSDVRIP